MLVFDVVGWMDASTVVAFGGVNFWPTWEFDVNFSFGSVVLGRFLIAVMKNWLAGVGFGYMAVNREQWGNYSQSGVHGAALIVPCINNRQS